jgi:hypothetical protein
MAFRKIEAGLVHAPVDEFIGKTGTIFYDNDLGDFRISDGQTPGGIALSFGGGGGDYTLPTATTTVKGGVKIDGTTIAITNQVIRVGTVPYSSLSGTPTIPTNNNQLTNGAAYITSAALSGLATETYVTTRGYLTTVAYADVTGKPTLFSGSYADLTNKPTLFSGSYADLTNKPTIPTNNNELTNGAAYITSAALSGLASETYVTTRGYITSAALSTYALTSSIPTDISQLTDTQSLLGQGGGGGGTTYITNNVANPFSFSIAGDDSTLREIANGESIKITGAGGITVTTDAEGNVTVTGTPASLAGYATESYVTSRGYITGLSFNDLTDKPNLAGTYTFNVAADDSTLRTIGTEETVKFVGAGGITTASDDEGKITITQGTTSSLVNGAKTFGLDSNGVITFTGSYSQSPSMFVSTAGFALSKVYASGGSATQVDIGNNVSITVGIGDDEITGLETAKGWYFKTDGDLEIPGNICSEGNINIEVNLTDSTRRRWQFGEDGALTFPNGMTMGDLDGAEGIQGSADTLIGIISQGIGGSATLQWVDDPEDATAVAAVVVNSLFAANTGTVQIITGDIGPVPEHSWTFGTDGSLTLPDGSPILFGGNNCRIQALQAFSISSDGGIAVEVTDKQWLFNPDGTLELPGDIRSNGNINIDINLTDSTLRRWQFGEDGALTLPEGGRINAVGYNNIVRLGNDGFMVANGSIFNENETGLSINGQNSDAGTYIQIPGRTASENGEPLIISHNWDAAINIQGGGGIWSFGSDGGITFPDDTVQTTAWTGVADYNNLINKPNLASTYQFSVAADDSTQRLISTDETVKFIGASGITTASDAEGNITITGPSLAGLATETFVTTRGYITSSALTGLATETFVTTQGYITGLSYNDLTDKPNLAGTYSWSIAADDSTQFEIAAGNLVKIKGAGGITTSSDADGNITITGAASDRLTSNARSAVLNSNGTFSLPTLTAEPATPQAGQMALANGTSWDPIAQNNGAPYMVIYTGIAWIGMGGVTVDKVYEMILEMG